MADPKEDLRATEESIRSDAARVKALEEEKMALDPEDPRVEDISRQVVQLTGGMDEKAKAERSLAEEIG